MVDRAYSFAATPVAAVTNADLLAEDLTGAVFYEATVYDYLNRPKAEKIQIAYFPETQRLGIAWGGDALWGTVDNLPRGIDMFLYDAESWELAN